MGSQHIVPPGGAAPHTRAPRSEAVPQAPAARRPLSPANRSRSGIRLVRGFAGARLRGHPLLLSHLVTGRCNACCPTCLWRDQDAVELDTEAVAWLYREAASAGLVQVVIWGGEPLLRRDLPELVRAASAAGLVVTLISNGWLLPERWPDLRGYVDALILSVDDVDGAHDRLRGLPGLFDRLDRFAVDLHRDPARPRLLINTVLSRENRGALRRVAPLARDWGAGLYFCPMEVGQMEAEGFASRLGPLALDPSELRAAARLARDLKAAGYPMLATDAYLDLLERDPALTGYTCRAPRLILTVEADGSVRDCLRRDVPLASVRQLRGAGRPLHAVFALPRYRRVEREAESCAACNNPDVVEMSWLWDLEWQMLERVGRLVFG